MTRFLGLIAVLLSLVVAPAASAADFADIGYIDQAALGSLPMFVTANRELNAYGVELQRQYQARARHASPAEQQRLTTEFQQKVADKQREILGPLFQKAQIAVASIASSKNLSVVIDRRIVVFGGVDITSNVRDLLTGVGDPVPPVNTPPPSTVGYVDHTQIDALPNIKSVTDDFNKWKSDEDKATNAKLKDARTDADRNAVLKDYQQTVQAKQAQMIQPLVDKTRDAMASVARKRGLALVVDRGNVIYGGTDITADVTNALK